MLTYFVWSSHCISMLLCMLFVCYLHAVWHAISILFNAIVHAVYRLVACYVACMIYAMRMLRYIMFCIKPLTMDCHSHLHVHVASGVTVQAITGPAALSAFQNKPQLEPVFVWGSSLEFFLNQRIRAESSFQNAVEDSSQEILLKFGNPEDSSQEVLLKQRILARKSFVKYRILARISF